MAVSRRCEAACGDAPKQPLVIGDDHPVKIRPPPECFRTPCPERAQYSDGGPGTRVPPNRARQREHARSFLTDVGAPPARLPCAHEHHRCMPRHPGCLAMRNAVITGSGSGIGLAATSTLVARGWRVIGVDQRDADVVADLRQRAERVRACSEVEQHCEGRADAAITCAGVSAFAGFGGDDVVSINYFGTVEVLNGLRPLLTRGTDTAVVVISSNSATTAPGIDDALLAACLDGDETYARRLGLDAGPAIAYAASKLALARWVRRNASKGEWIGEAITLNAIAPGLIDTPMTRAMREIPAAAAMMDKAPPLVGRPGQPIEVAELAAYMVGPSARFMVGSVVYLDGGKDALIRADDWPAPRRPR